MPLIWVTTHEEGRFIRSFIMEIAEKKKQEIFTWSAYRGLSRGYDPQRCDRASGEFDKTWVPTTCLEKIVSTKKQSEKYDGQIFILKDFHIVMGQPVPRQIRDIYEVLVKNSKCLLVVAPCLAHGPGGNKPGLEPTLEKMFKVVNFELPTRDHQEALIRDQLSQCIEAQSKLKKKSKIKLEYTDDELHKNSVALQGLTHLEAEDAVVLCLQSEKKLDERILLQEKKQVIKRSEILEYIEQSPLMTDIGGLDSAKEYFEMYSNQFSAEAKAFGVEPLRGVLMVGVPGCGKSLIAKAVSAAWGLPLLRLDVGKVMTGLVGGSEEKMRQVIGQTEAIAPCVLWIDEIEKSLSGTKSSNFSDGGTLARVFGTLLTAMEERMEGVVTLATANDINALPPELIRRFNETLFVDLPVPSEREEIFKIHLRKRGRDPEKLNLDYAVLVAASDKYTGSEIEKSVKEAIVRSFRDGKSKVKTEDVLGAVQDTKAIAQVMGEKINTIREWARNRARYASSLAAEAAGVGCQRVATGKGKILKLSDLDEDLDQIKTSKQEVEELKSGHTSKATSILDE